MTYYMKLCSQKNTFSVIIALLIIVSLIYNSNVIKAPSLLPDNSLGPSSAQKPNQSIKYILQFHYTKVQNLCYYIQFTGCEVSSCYFTRDINLMPIEEFDAILFHESIKYSRNIKLITKRKPFQKYIFYDHESPVTYPIVFKKNFYNLTISYRRDADVYKPYQRVENRVRENIIDKVLLMEQVHNKTKLIAWVVSNCKTFGVHDRKKLYKQISKYIPIDVYGKCGNLTCPGRMSNECYQLLNKKYKFVLAFENSYCRDYITEKTFDILRLTNIVPIVFGHGDYKTFAPQNSVINVEDFSSAKHLTDYLKFLDKNPEEYIKFFEWKRHFWINNLLFKEMCCNMCKKLHEPLKYVWYGDMEKWSLGENSSVCPKFHNKWLDNV